MSRVAQAVRVGLSRFVHIRNGFDRNLTRCGLRNDAGTLFENTTEPPTCAFCQVVTTNRKAS